MTDSFIEETLVTAFKTLQLIKSKVVSVNGVSKTIFNYSEINKAFDKSNWAKEGWYELDIIPGEPYQSELGTNGRNRWVGIFQITVCVPLDSGKLIANARYDAIAEIFKRGTVFSGVAIDKCHRRPNLSSDMEGVKTDHYRLPVRVAYRADLAN